MEQFEEIRRGDSAGETILQLAKKHGVHRRMVRQAISSAIPPEKKVTVQPPLPLQQREVGLAGAAAPHDKGPGDGEMGGGGYLAVDALVPE